MRIHNPDTYVNQQCPPYPHNAQSTTEATYAQTVMNNVPSTHPQANRYNMNAQPCVNNHATNICRNVANSQQRPATYATQGQLNTNAQNMNNTRSMHQFQANQQFL